MDNCSEIPGRKKRKFWRAKWLQEISSDIPSSEFIFGSADKRERKANELFGLHKKRDIGQLASSWGRVQHDWQWPGVASCHFCGYKHESSFFTSASSVENYFCHKIRDLSLVLVSFHLSWSTLLLFLAALLLHSRVIGKMRVAQFSWAVPLRDSLCC